MVVLLFADAFVVVAVVVVVVVCCCLLLLDWCKLCTSSDKTSGVALLLFSQREWYIHLTSTWALLPLVRKSQPGCSKHVASIKQDMVNASQACHVIFSKYEKKMKQVSKLGPNMTQPNTTSLVWENTDSFGWCLWYRGGQRYCGATDRRRRVGHNTGWPWWHMVAHGGTVHEQNDLEWFKYIKLIRLTATKIGIVDMWLTYDWLCWAIPTTVQQNTT